MLVLQVWVSGNSTAMENDPPFFLMLHIMTEHMQDMTLLSL